MLRLVESFDKVSNETILVIKNLGTFVITDNDEISFTYASGKINLMLDVGYESREGVAFRDLNDKSKVYKLVASNTYRIWNNSHGGNYTNICVSRAVYDKLKVTFFELAKKMIYGQLSKDIRSKAVTLSPHYYMRIVRTDLKDDFKLFLFDNKNTGKRLIQDIKVEKLSKDVDIITQMLITIDPKNYVMFNSTIGCDRLEVELLDDMKLELQSLTLNTYITFQQIMLTICLETCIKNYPNTVQP